MAAEAGIQTLYGFRPEACRNERPAPGDNGDLILWSGNKKAIDLALTHVLRMGLAPMEFTESENPVAIDVLGTVGIVVISGNLANLVHQT